MFISHLDEFQIYQSDYNYVMILVKYVINNIIHTETPSPFFVKSFFQ